MEKGKIGRPFLARIFYMGHEVERMQDPNNWKGTKDKAGGGVLLDGGYHVIDIMNMLFGLPQEVKGVCSKSVIDVPNKSEDNAILLVKYADNMFAEISASFTIKFQNSKKNPTLGIRLEVYGTEGSIWTEYLADPVAGWQTTLVSDDKKTHIPDQPFTPDNLPLHFIDCIVNGTEPIVTAEDALRVHEIVDDVYRQCKFQ
jgi:predicted dehydrogenase